MRILSCAALAAALVAGGTAATTPAAHAAPAPATAAAAAPEFPTAPAPKITGYLTPGYVLTADAGTWNPTPTKLTYTFYRADSAGVKVKLQSGPSNKYTVQAADVGMRLRVEVTAERAGYAPTTRISLHTLHVLTPQQRAVLASTGGDWHDMHFADGPDGSEPPTTWAAKFPYPVRGAYVTLTCRGTYGGSPNLEYADANGTLQTVAELGTAAPGYTGSTVVVLAATDKPMTSATILCNGDWSLSVRPAATTPMLPASVSGTGSAAYLQSGNAVTRTFRTTTSVTGAGADLWVNSATNVVVRFGAVAPSARQVTIPAGSRFVGVDTVRPWSLS